MHETCSLSRSYRARHLTTGLIMAGLLLTALLGYGEVLAGPGTSGVDSTSHAGTLFASGFGGPFGLAFDSTGNLYVANEMPDGSYGNAIAKITPGGVVSSFATGFTGPSGVAFDSSGLMHVSDDTGRVFSVSSGGVVTEHIGVAAGLNNPNAVVFDSADNLYVATANGGTVSKFDSSGTVIDMTFVHNLFLPQGLVVDDAASLIYILDGYGKIWQADLTTGAISQYANPGYYGGTNGGLARDSAGNLYYSAYQEGRIVRVDPTSRVGSICQSGLTTPRGLAIDASDNIYVTSYDDGTITQFTGCEARTTGAAWGFVDDGANPVESVEVCANYDDNGDFIDCTCTDADGRYVLYNVEFDRAFNVKAGGPRRNCGSSNYIQQTVNGLTANSSTPDVQQDFSLSPGGLISGKVTESDGTTPIENASVCVNEYDNNNHLVCTNTETDGTYVIMGLPSNDYRVDANADGFATEYYSEHAYWDAANRVTVIATNETPDIDFTLEQGGTISGIVTESDGTTPIENADVCVNSYYNNDNHIGCVSTESDGTYSLEGVPTGNFRVDARATGYTSEFYNEQSQWHNANLVVVTAPNETPGIDFTLDPAGSISGTVTESDGTTPIANADVCVNFYDGGDHVQCLPTEADGTYYLEGVPAGDFRVEASAPGFVNEYYQEQAQYDQADRVTVTPPGETANIDFTLDPAGSISGTVTESDGTTPIYDAHVCVNFYDSGDHIQCVYTDYDGTYSVDTVPAGDFRVNARASGFIEEYYSEQSDWNAANRVTVTAPNNTLNINFTLDLGGSISGTVTDGTNPIANAQVCVSEYPFGRGYGCWIVDASGFYQMDGLPTGDYRVEASAPGFARELYFNKPYFGDHNNADPVSVTAGSNTPFIHFELDPGGSISGIVYDETGTNPLGGVPVDTRPWGGYGVCTEPDGSYTMDGLPLNTDIYVYAGGQQWGGCDTLNREPQYWDGAFSMGAASPIQLTTGSENATGKNFSLGVAGSISGVVTESDGTTPISNAQVCVNFYDSDDHIMCIGVEPDGTYQVDGIPTGDFRVNAMAPGFIEEYYDENWNWSDADRVTVVPPNDTPNIDFTLTAGGTITGTVTENDGTTGINWAFICATDDPWHGSQSFCTRSQPNGTYEITVPGGTWYVEADADGWAREYYDDKTRATADSISVTAGVETSNIDFVLGREAKVTGRVVDAATGNGIANVTVEAHFDGWGHGICTDDQGYYTLDSLPLGHDFRVQANGNTWCSGPNNYIPEYWQETPDRNQAVVFNLTEVTRLQPDIDFTLELGGSISGVVTDGTNPIENADVCIQNYDNGQGFNCIQTASDGTYQFTGMPAGDFRVEAIANGFIREFYQETSNYNAASRVTVTPPNDTANINFTLEPGGFITGTVTDGTNPLNWVLVCAVDDPQDETLSICGYTQADGTYQITVGAGTWYVKIAIADGYALEFYDDKLRTNADPVDVTIGATTPNIDFALGPDAQVSGRVTDADTGLGIAGVVVNAQFDGWADGTCTDSNGYYTLEGLPLGVDFRVQANSDTWCSGPNNYIPEYWQETSDHNEAVVFNLTEPTRIKENIDFTLGKGGTFSGTVTDGTNPVGGAWVWVYNVGQDSFHFLESTAPDGTYASMAIPPGTYYVFANADGYAAQGYDSARPGDTPVAFVVTVGSSETGVDFVLGPDGSISGTVYASDGVTPLESVYVGVEDSLWPGACTAADGTFTINSLPLDTQLYAYAGEDDHCDHPTEYIKEWWQEVPDKASATAITLETGVSEDQSGFEFTLLAVGETPAAPSNLTATTQSGTEIALAWTDNATNEDAYEIEWSANGTDGWTLLDTLAADTTTYTDDSLSCGTTRHYRVRATNAAGESAWSNVASDTTTICPPAAPTDLESRARSADYILVGWTDNATNEDAYEVEWSANGTDGWTLLDTLAADTDLYMDDGLNCGTTRHYRVRATNAGGPSAWSNVVSDATTVCPPAAPSDLTATGQSITRIVVDWQDNSDNETSFVLERSANGVDGWIELAVTGADIETHNDMAVACGSTYYYRAYAMNAGGVSATTPVADGATLACEPVEVPVPELNSPRDRSTTADTTPKFTWKSVKGAAQYTVQISTDPDFGTVEIDDDTPRSNYGVAAADALDYGIYYWRVMAHDANGNQSEWSLVRMLEITLHRSPKNAQHLIDTTPKFTWASVRGSTGYELEIHDTVDLDHTIDDYAGNATRYVPSSTLPSGELWWRVRVQLEDDIGNPFWSAWSPAWSLTVTNPPASSPDLIAPARGTLTQDTTPTFEWGTVPDGHQYQIRIDNKSNFKSPLLDVTLGAGVTSYTPASALPDGKWYWQVRAINAVGVAGKWSGKWHVTIDTTPPDAPTLRKPNDFSATRDTTPKFVWKGARGSQQYHIQVATDDTFTNRVVDDDTVNRSRTVANLNAVLDTPLFWRVKARDAAGNWGDWSDVFHLTVTSTPNKPDEVVLSGPAHKTETSDNNVTFSWQTATNATTYQLQIDNQSNFKSPLLDTVTGNTLRQMFGMADGRYYWRVRGVNSDGVAGPWSDKWLVTVDTTAPDAPRRTAPKDGSATADTTPKFTWKNVKGARFYEVAIYAGDTCEGTADVTSGSQTRRAFVVPAADALAFGSYAWCARAGDVAGNWGAWSAPNTFDVTLAKSPKDGSKSTNDRPRFEWANGGRGVTYVVEIADNDTFSDPVLFTYTGGARQYRPPTALDSGTWYWRIKIEGGDWMPVWSVTITPRPPAKVKLDEPRNNTLTNDNTPTFQWYLVKDGVTYQLQVDDDRKFRSPEVDQVLADRSYSPATLPDGRYYWRVRALNSVDAPGKWSARWKLTIDATAPDTPIVTAPIDEASVTNKKLKLDWGNVSGATRYEVQLDTTDAFTAPIIEAGRRSDYKPRTPLDRGVYVWRVRAVDKAGNVSAWSATLSFEIVAGVTEEGTPTPTPTVAPAIDESTDTVEPTATPDAPTDIPPTEIPPTDPPLVLTGVEAEAALVGRSGDWTQHSTDRASGGSYLYSGGSATDALVLRFAGTALDVVYVKHPALGSFVIEIDGTALLVVDQSAEAAAFEQVASITGLSDGEHLLRVYPVSGTIALDAFRVLRLPAAEPTDDPPATDTPPVDDPTATPEAGPWQEVGDATDTPVPPDDPPASGDSPWQEVG